MKVRELLFIPYMFREEILNNFMRRKCHERRRKAGMSREKRWKERVWWKEKWAKSKSSWSCQMEHLPSGEPVPNACSLMCTPETLMRCASTSLWTLVRRPSTSIDTRLCNPANPYSPALSDMVYDGFVVGKSDNHLSDSSRREMATLKVAETVVFPCFSRSHHLCTKFTGSWSCMEAWHSTKLIPSISRLLDRCPSTVLASCQVSWFVASAVSLLLSADSLPLGTTLPSSIFVSLWASTRWEAHGQVGTCMPYDGHLSPAIKRPRMLKIPGQSVGILLPLFVSCTLFLGINAAKQLAFMRFNICIFKCIITCNPHLNKVPWGRNYCWCC